KPCFGREALEVCLILIISAGAGCGVASAILIAVHTLIAALGCTTDQRTCDCASGTTDDCALDAVIGHGCTDGRAANAADRRALLGRSAGCDTAKQQRQN